MRREFGTAEPPSSEVELGRGRANGLVHVHCLPPRARLKALEAGFVFFFPRSCESETCEKQSACQTKDKGGLTVTRTWMSEISFTNEISVTKHDTTGKAGEILH